MARGWGAFFVYAIKKGVRHEQAEDFAQVGMLEDFQRHPNPPRQLRWIWVDFLRETVAGRTSTQCFSQRLAIAEPVYPKTQAALDSLSGAYETSESMDEHLKGLPLYERVVTVLILKWGLDQKEVAHVFGISQSRMSQIVKRIVERFEGTTQVGNC